MSSHWMRQHARPQWAKDGRLKIRHESQQAAQEHVDRIRMETGELVEAYACRWSDDPEAGESAPEHWHVGHPVFVSRPHLRKGLCADRADHRPHTYQSASLGPFWCTANERHREPARSQRRMDWELAQAAGRAA